MRGDLEPQASLPWLVRFRWLALGGQLAALLIARFGFGEPVSWPVLGALLGTTAASNAALAAWVGRNPESPRAARVLGGILILDTLLLAGLLAASGGATNPFSVLFLVHITLAAVILGARWTTLIAALAIACFGALFLIPMPQWTAHAHHQHHHAATGEPFSNHLYGMWAAFTLAAVLIAYFVRQIATTIALQREQIAALRESAARHARLASLTTLAAGAAHELGTPLGTISVAAHEMDLAAARLPDAEAFREDTRLILAEVERCQDILLRMAARAGEGDPGSLAVPELEELVRARLDPARSARVRVTASPSLGPLRLPREHTLQSVTALVNNALDAGGDGAPVRVQVERDGDGVRICVEDQGAGMPEEILAKAGEPFFTTKEPGRGLGLGLFLARAFAESQGGSLSLDSRVGHGTRATLRLPGRALPQQEPA